MKCNLVVRVPRLAYTLTCALFMLLTACASDYSWHLASSVDMNMAGGRPLQQSASEEILECLTHEHRMLLLNMLTSSPMRAAFIELRLRLRIVQDTGHVVGNYLASDAAILARPPSHASSFLFLPLLPLLLRFLPLPSLSLFSSSSSPSTSSSSFSSSSTSGDGDLDDDDFHIGSDRPWIQRP